MSVKTRYFTLFSSAFAALLLLAATFSACESTLGFGDPIDWEAPVLQFRPVPDSPMTVRGGAILTGIVTDNIGVTSVIARDANTGKEMPLFQVILIGDNPKMRTWEIVMNFEEKDNNTQIPLEIVAYDKAGNSGAQSMVAVTIKVDTRPPIVRDMQIHRTATRTADLESFAALYALEKGEVTPANPFGLGSDPDGEISANANRYQNGVFTFKGTVAETETFIEIISLNIYDIDRTAFTETLLLEVSRSPEYPPEFSPFSPQWEVTEEQLLAAGEAKKAGYKNAYYNDHTRYYYRVEIVAKDSSKNESNDDDNIIKENEGYFVMWEKADEPKGVIDPLVIPNNPGGISIQKGSQLPVVFFDDDQLAWAYTGFLTIEQWNGAADLNTTNLRMSGSQAAAEAATDTEKLEWLKAKLDDPTVTINNWKQASYSSGPQEKIEEQIKSKSLDDHIVYIQVGNSASDNGEYRLFTLVGDKKLAPHPTSPNVTDPVTYQTRETHRVYTVNVIDENEPLIYFDTSDPSKTSGHLGSPPHEMIVGAQTGNSPEENTFPKLNEDGRTFTINGYTLRDNKPGQNNRVVKFRVAWIPNAITDDARIRAVKAALQADDYLPPSTPPSGSMAGQYDEGVRHWNFALRDERHPDNYPNTTTYEPYTLLTGTSQILAGVTDGSFLKKQVFKKTFDLLEDFMYDGKLENDTKLFIFFAEDDMGHGVFRELRLLGKKTPPDIAIYDISGKINDALMPATIPNVGASPYLGDAEKPEYYNALNEYNTRPAVYTLLKGATASLTDADRTIPFQIYTRGTILKYWVTAAKNGDINIESIKMQDITVTSAANARVVGSAYNTTDSALTYTEYFPDEAQRVFLFTATDSLGNVAQVQRTVAITNTARLDSITTTSGSGTYGIGKTITLKANFSGQISITGTPQLNVRYQFNGNVANLAGRTYTQTGNYIYESINCQPVSTSTLALEFIFTVPEGAAGQLVTMYAGDNLGGVDTTGDPPNVVDVHTDRPIRLLNNAHIIDNIRGVDAFVPGYKTGSTSMPKWTTNRNSLQETKTIMLDGTRPVITSVSVSGKTAYATNQYYFKTDETIQLTLSTAANGKNIRASSPTAPRLQYYIDPLGGGTVQGPYYANFTYLRPSPSGSRGLVFGLEVNTTNCPIDGELVNVSLYTSGGTIEDEVGNTATFNNANLLNLLSPAPSGTTGGTRIYIKKSISNPASTLGGTALASASATWNTNPSLVIPASAHTNTTLRTWEDVRQYSLNGGLEWVTYSAAYTVTNGTWDVRTRYVDRAGNESPTTAKSIEVNTAFPRLLGITSTKANGTYNRGNSLSFTLDFADNVSIGTSANITLTLRDTTNTTNNTDGTSPSYEIQLTGATLATNNKTITFTWTSVNDKDMLNGLRVYALNLSGLRDRFQNAGPSSFTQPNTTTVRVSQQTGVPTQYDVAYNLTGTIVSGIAPKATSYSPVNAATLLTGNVTTAVSSDNKTITITFSKPMQRGRGTITVRPHGNYAIPAVFENEGYYMSVNLTTGVEIKEGQTNYDAANRIYVSGMNDVFNNMTAAQRNYMITGGTLSAPTLSAQTGLSVGPYKKMTHGLKQGAGYTGDYNNTSPTAPNAPGTTGSTYMVPDTTTKWVLAYTYEIHNATANSEVSNIRTALTSIGFRRQQIAVTSTANVAISNTTTNGTVTITLSEPLLPGLQWDLYYPEGTFTDLAGNSAPAVADASYWFWSRGVQKPVIRVDRKSYDGRQTVPPAGTGNTAVPQTFNNTGAYAGTIASFNTVAYRIETETPGARIFYRTQEGTETNGSSITGLWTGRATDATLGANFNTSATLNWNGQKTTDNSNNNATIGAWVRRNLIFRNYTNGTYTVTENGITVTQQVSNTQANTSYYGFRSFNRDALFSELSGNPALTDSGVNNMYAGAFNYADLQASKNYVAADARIDHSNAAFTTATYTSQRGYEGVFRTVMALHQNGSTGGGNNYISLCGTNVKSGIPTVAGFPVKDGVANGDTRYLKLFYFSGNQYYWVSTEIVTPWYMQNYGRGNNPAGSDDNSYGRIGDATDWVTAGYGDLSYAFDMYTW